MRWRVLRGAGAPALLALLLATAVAQDRAPRVEPARGVRVPVEVRVDRTLVNPGKPLGGASLAFVLPGESPGDAAPRAVMTGADGRAVAQGPAGGGVLLVWAKDRAPVALWAAGPLIGAVILDPARSMTVYVRDPAAQPVADAYVEVEVRLPVSGAPLGSATGHVYAVAARTAADGTALFTALPPVNLRVRAEAEGFVGPELFPVRAAGSATAPGVPVTLDLVAGARIAGRASVVPGGGPAQGAVIRAGRRTARVGADGNFELTAVPPGPVEITLDGIPEARDLLLREPVVLVLGNGERRAGVNLTLVRTSVLSGVVVGKDGNPLQGAGGTLYWPASRAPWSERRLDLPDLVAADAGGRFRIAGLAPAEGVAFEVRAPGHAPTLVEGLSLPAGKQAAALRIELDPGALITGRVVDAGGGAVQGAHVEARAVGDAPERPAADTAVTGPAGAFLLDALPARPIWLRIVPPAGSPWRTAEAGPFSPGADVAGDVGDLTLRHGHELRGSVRGAPADAVVRVVGSDDDVHETPLEGRDFALDGLPPGAATVAILSPSSAGSARARVRLPMGWPLALTWRAAAPVTLRLRGARGRAVTSAELTFDPRASEDASEEPPRAWALRTGDVEGIYSVELEPGRWLVSARSGAWVGAAPIDVAPDGGAQLTLLLTRGETVRGFVGARSGSRPLEGARVTVEPFGDGSAPALQGVTDAWGGFEIEGVAPGIVRVVVQADGYARWTSSPLAVRSAETTDLGQVELVLGGAVTGIVRDALGTPARGAGVVAEHEDGTLRETRSDLHGRFRVEHLAPGAITLRVGDVLRFVDLPLGATEVTADLDLAAGVVLRGRVTTDGRPEPYAGITAFTFGPGAREARVHTAADGRFELPPLPPGAARLEVLAAGSELPISVPVTLPVADEDWLDVELPAGGVAGQVRDESGRAVPGARLWLWELDDDGLPGEVVSRGTSGADGRFTLRRVAAGRYEVEARREGHGEGRSPPFEVGDGALSFGVAVDLTLEATLTVEIVDERGLPVAGGWISALPDEPGESGTSRAARVRTRARAAADGRALLRSLAPGFYEVAVGGPGRGRQELGVLRLIDGLTDIGRVMLEAGGAMRINALHPGFVPASGVGVRVEDLFGRDPRAADGPMPRGFGSDTTAADGTLLVPDLAPGFYRVWIEGDDAESAYMIAVRSGEVVTVAIWARWPEDD